MLNNVRFNGKTPPIFYISIKDKPVIMDEDVAIVGKAIVDESKVSDEQSAVIAGMKQVHSMYLNGRMVYNYRPCEKLELNAGEVVLTNTVDNSFKLSVKVTPSNCTEEVTFTSSNTDVATVNRDGSIHPVNLGTCDIIVTCDKKSVACKVHVKEQTLYLYNRGVVNNNSEFGQIVHPSDTSKFRYATDNIFLTLAGSTSNYGTIWFSWANRVDFGEYDVMHMDITNAADHSTIIGLTRNNKTGQQGYQNGNPTDIDGTTFVEDRTVIALKQGVNKHSLDVDLVNGVGYLGLYFKRNTGTGDTLEEFININTIYLIRKSVYIIGTGVDTSEEVNVPCTGLSFTQDEIDLEYTGNTIYNLNTLLSIDPQNCDERVQWTVIDDGDHVMDVNDTGYLSITGLGSAHVQAICGKYFDSIRVNTISSCTGVSLNTTSATLDLSGTKTVTLTATITPSNTTDNISWQSSNISVATVNNGVVTAKGNGSCTITATCGGKSATCNVTVKTSCTGVSLSKSTYTLDLSGTDSVTFTPTINPSNTTDSITWKSSNTSVATVSATSGGTKGTIFAKSTGTANITVNCGSKSASVTVTVKASCTGVSLNKTNLSFTSLNDTQTLTATLTPSNTTDTVTWKSSNTAVATVNSSGVVTSKAIGSCTITATCGSKSATCNVVVDIEEEPIEIIINEITIKVGETYDATRLYTLQAGYNVQYKYSSIIAIEGEHTIVGKEVGTTNLEIICGKIIKNVTVKVIAPSVPSVVECTSITVSPTSMTVNEGDFVAFYSDIRVSVQPSNCTQPVTFRTGNADVMSPSIAAEGVYQAWGPGSTTLTAYCGEQWANCRVTVQSKEIPCTGITLKATPSDTISIGEEVYINVTLSPSNCTENYTMSVSGSAIGENGYAGLYIGQSVGSSTVTVRCGNISKSITIYVNRN